MQEKLRTYEDIYKRIGVNLQYLRLKKGWTQSELAKECGTSQVNISYAESAVRKPSQKIIDRLCEIFDVTLEDLVVNVYQEEDNE